MSKTSPTSAERIAELERENDRLRSQIADETANEAPAPQGPRRGGKWRAPVSAILIVLAIVLSPLAVFSHWGNAQLTNTDAFVAAYAPLAADPAVQRVVTDKTTEFIESQIDVPALTDSIIDGLASTEAPSQAVSAIRSLQGPLNIGISKLIRSTVSDLVKSDAFATTWTNALRISHSQIIRTASGDPSATIAIGEDGTLGVQLAPIVSEAQAALVAQGLSAAAAIPEVNITVPIATDVSLQGVTLGYSLGVAATTWMPWVSLGLLVAGILVARNTRRALIGAAAGLAIAMAVLLVVFDLARAVAPTFVPLPADAVGSVLSAVVDPIGRTAAAILTVAGLAAVIGWFAGPAPLATKLRGLEQAAAATLRQQGERFHLSSGKFGTWLERAQTAARIGVAVIAGLAVFLVRPLTPGVIFGTLALAVLALFLVDVLRRPAAGAGGAPAEADDDAPAHDSTEPGDSTAAPAATA